MRGADWVTPDRGTSSFGLAEPGSRLAPLTPAGDTEEGASLRGIERWQLMEGSRPRSWGTTGTLRCRWNAAWLLLLALMALGLKEDDPDVAVNLQCYWSKVPSVMNCSWSIRDLPGVHTICILHYESLKFHPKQSYSEKSQSEENWLLIARNKLRKGDTYSIWLEVQTAGRTVTSNKITVSLDEIVKPPPPDVDLVDPTECDSSGARITWKTPNSSEPLTCALRYKVSKDQDWTYLHQDEVGQEGHYLENLKPFTSYEVQARCFQNEGFWSEWSSARTFRTLEAAPLGQVDVWQAVDASDSQKRLLLWKALDSEAAQGKILDYEVSYQNHGQNITKGTWPCCRAVLPSTAGYAWISARNSVKQTQVANLSLEQSALPGPEDVQVQALEDRGFRVTWKPSASPLWVQPEEYVVEWREELPSTNEALDWTRVPGSSGSTLLIGHFKPKLPYLVRVYALHSHGNSASAPTRAYFKEEAPSNSPQALRDRRISSAVCNVSWEEIPLVDRNGHITHYTLYLKQQDSVTSKLHKTIAATEKSHQFTDLTPGTTYQFCMTGSTSAGEGRASPEHHFHMPGAHWQYIMTVTLVMGCLLIMASVVGLIKYRRVIGVCHKILAQCGLGRIPDPGHSAVFQKTEGQNIVLGMNIPSLSSAPYSEGMDFIEIKESTLPLTTTPAPPMFSGYEKRFMPTQEELQKLA
ncbi:interleukin-27 receptor subunit alpha isoform X2 [Varanus komodoensis]|uniref:interleukin-27 receptor subunit alpha isoform X2 n=1 Tax=Varanus komodoensis TaxID=61221 RepID=UPI001CF7BD16|nr:interleukin-27 receptor subunit alpha isoform X2 [Varanus komodoensis]